MKNKIKHISLFSCLGAVPFGFEQVNSEINTVLLHEPNKACKHLLEHFWDSEVTSDMEKLIEGVKKHAGTTDVVSARHRKKNWAAIRSVVEIARPKVVVIESMASVRSNGIVEILQDFRALNYDVEGHIIPASAFGAIYNGERFWIIAHSNADGLPENSKSSSSQRELGKQYITNELLDEYRTQLERGGPAPGGSVFNKPRVLRRDERVSRRVDATRVRFLSDDASPVVSGFIGFCVTKIFKGECRLIPTQKMTVVDMVRNATKKTNFIMNTEKLIENGIEFTRKNSGLHLMIETKDGFIDYWPSTDVYIVRGTKDRGFGVQNVLIRAKGQVVKRKKA